MEEFNQFGLASLNCSCNAVAGLFGFTCLCFFLVESLSEVPDTLIHHGHLHVTLVKHILVLLYLAVLFLV